MAINWKDAIEVLLPDGWHVIDAGTTAGYRMWAGTIAGVEFIEAGKLVRCPETSILAVKEPAR